MNKRTLHRLFSVLMALVMAVSLLTGCRAKTAEKVEKQGGNKSAGHASQNLRRQIAAKIEENEKQ